MGRLSYAGENESVLPDIRIVDKRLRTCCDEWKERLDNSLLQWVRKPKSRLDGDSAVLAGCDSGAWRRNVFRSSPRSMCGSHPYRAVQR
jgi:hypothetical protein